MSDTPQYGLEQARAQLPLIASEAVAGYSSVITRHGKPVADLVPVQPEPGDEAPSYQQPFEPVMALPAGYSAVKALISRAITACRATGKYIGICGQGPSDHPDFADCLAAEGIVSISLNPDTVVETWTLLGQAKA